MRQVALSALLTILLLGAGRVHAEVLAAIGANMVFELSPDGRNYEARTPISVRGGYRFDLADAFVEYTNFRTASGTSMLDVQREHQEFLLWGRKIFCGNSCKDWIVAPYAGAGVGFEYDRVTTTFGLQKANEPQKANEIGDPLAMFALAAGARVAIIENLELLIEGRMSFASDYQPNPLFGSGLSLGFAF